jgi:hypothetical protein
VIRQETSRFFESQQEFPKVSADRHLADSYLALFLKVGGIFVQKRVWIQLVLLNKTAAFCFTTFTRVATTRATLKIMYATLNETLDRAKGNAARFGDV